MMQSYNDFIFALDQKMCLHIHFYSKNVLTHTFLFKNWPYTYIFISMLFVLNNTYRTADKKYSEASKCYCEASLTYIEMKLQSDFSDETKLQLKCNSEASF